MTALAGLLSLLGILIGLISVAVPLRVLGIRSRRTALTVAAICSATLLAAVALDHRSGGPVEVSKRAGAAGQQAVAAPIVDSGCHLAGALPNCEEEVARLVAAKAANPTPVNQSSLLEIRQSNGSDVGRDYVTEIMNEFKASEASANVRAIAAQREFDAALYRIGSANERFERTVTAYDAAAQRTKLERDSFAYDRRIRQRERERKRRGY